jgi:trans-aconitate methyltransferase
MGISFYYQNIPMETGKAIQLIQDAFKGHQEPVAWADLGCGSGTFTKALATLLEKGSAIYAVDRSLPSLNKLPAVMEDVIIHKAHVDFITEALPAHDLDGVLMANSLHYVADKPSLIHKLSIHLRPNATLLIVEYDSDRANQWVPYPIPFTSLEKLFQDNGYAIVEKIGEQPSVYNSGGMYAALIKR